MLNTCIYTCLSSISINYLAILICHNVLYALYIV